MAIMTSQVTLAVHVSGEEALNNLKTTLNEVEKLLKKDKEIKFTVESGDLNKISKTLSEISNQFKNLGSDVDFSKSVGGTESLSSLSRMVDDLGDSIKNLGNSKVDMDISPIMGKVDTIKSAISSMTVTISNGTSSKNVNAGSSMSDWANQFSKEADKIASSAESSVQKLNQALSTGSYQKIETSQASWLSQYSNIGEGMSESLDKARQSANEYRNLFKALQNDMEAASKQGVAFDMDFLLGQGWDEATLNGLDQKLKDLASTFNNFQSAAKIEIKDLGLSSMNDTLNAVEKLNEALAQNTFGEQASNLQTFLDSFSNINSSQFDDLIVKLKQFQQDFADLQTNFKENGGQLNLDQLGWDDEKINNFSKSWANFQKNVRNTAKEFKNLGGAKVKQAMEDLDAGEYTKDIDKLRESISKLDDSEAKSSFTNMANDVQSSYDKMCDALHQDMGVDENVRAAAEAVDEFESKLSHAETAVNMFTRSSTSGLSSFAKTLAGDLSSAAEMLNQIVGYNAIFREIRQGAQECVSAVIEIDTAMNQLQIVTGANTTEMEEFFENSIAQAKELGQSVTDVLDSIQVYSRLGYNLTEASELAKYTSILSNVAAVDVNEATEGLTSVIKGFDLSVDDAEHVSDVLIEVGQNYAVSASEILEAFMQSSAAFGATGTTFEEASAIIAAGNAAVQNANTVGTALKTVSARIRRSVTELDELGESYDDLADGFSKYRDELLSLTGFDIMEEGSTNDFKSIYDIFDGISKAWDKLTETQQSRVSEILGGTRQLQVISSILNNWDDATNAYADAMDSAGVATEAQSTYMESLQAKMDQFNASTQELYYDLLSSDVVGEVVDIGTEAVQVIDYLTDSYGALAVAMGALGLISATKSISTAFETMTKKGVGFFDALSTTHLGTYATNFGNLIKAMVSSMMGLVAGTQTAKGVLDAFGGALQTLWISNPVGTILTAVTAVAAGVAVYKNFFEETTEDIIKAGEEAQSAIAEINSDYESTAEAVGDIDIEKYTGYMQSVNSRTNENQGLTNDEYQEYLDISNELGELFPSLVSGFDSQGNAMLDLSSNADTATDSLNDLLEQERDLANYKIAEQIQDVAAGVAVQNEELEKQIQDYANLADLSEEMWNLPNYVSAQYKDSDLYNLTFDMISESSDEIEEASALFRDALENADLLGRINPNVISSTNAELAEGIYRQEYQLLDLTEEEIERFQEEYKNLLDEAGLDLASYYRNSEEYLDFAEAESNLRIAEAQQKELWSEIAPSLQAYVATLGDFLTLSGDTDLQNTLIDGINSMIGNFDITDLDKEGQQAFKEDVKGWVNDTFIEPILEASVDGRDDALEAYATLFDLDIGNMTMDKARETIDEAVKTIFPEDEEAQLNLKLMLGLDVETDSGVVEATWVEAVQGIADTLGISYKEAHGYFSDANWNIGDIEIGYELVLSDSNIDSLDELSERVDETKENIKDSISLYDVLSNEDEGNFSERIDTFQSDIEDISSALESLRNGEEISLTDLVQDFPELVNSLDDLEYGLNQLSLEKLNEFSLAWDEAFSGADTEELEKINKLFNETVSDVDVSYYTDLYKEAFAEYEDIATEVAKSSVDTTETVFGNIDTNNRQILEWTEQNLSEYQNAIESWGMSAEDLAGSYSTILSQSSEYDGAEITFSPMLQTENGPVLLTKDAVGNYLTQLLESLPEGWTEADLITADAQGISGNYISGLVAGITEGADEAERLGEALHLVGDTGAYQNVENELEKITKQIRDTAYDNIMANVDSRGAFTRQGEILREQIGSTLDEVFDMYAGDEAAIEAIIKLSANPDAANWDIEQWIAQIEDEEVYINLRVTEDSLTELQDTLDGLQEEQDLIESSQSLSEAMNIKKTTKDYKQLIDNSKKQVSNLKDQNNLLEVQKGLYKDLGRDTKDIQEQINSNNKAINSALEDQISWNNEALALNYNQAAEGIDAIRTALSEATSDTLLSSDSITNLVNALSDLADFDATDVFYQTANGVDLNTTALKHLEDEYVALKKQDYQSQLAELGKEYQEAKAYADQYAEGLDGLSDATRDAVLEAAEYRGLSDIESDIMYVDLLSTELDGLTSAYQTWVNAQAQGSYADAFQSMGDYYSTAEDLINRGWVGNEGLNAYLDLMLSAEQRTGDVQADFAKLTETIEGTPHSLMDYFQYNENGDFVNGGLYNFVDDVITTMGDAYARLDEETGQYELGIWSEEDVQAVADRFGTTAETIYWMIDAMKEAGFEVTTTEDYLQDAIEAAQNGTESLKELQSEGTISEGIDLEYEVSELSADEVENKIAELEEEKARIEVDYDSDDAEAQEAISELDAMIGALENRQVQLNIETEIEEGNLQELNDLIAQGDLESFAIRVGADVENEEEVAALAEVVQQFAQQERVEVAVEAALENGETLEELAQYDEKTITQHVGVEGAEDAKAAVDYVQNAFDEEKTWDMTVRIDEDQFEQLTSNDSTVDVGANTEPAMTTVSELVESINGMEATITVNTETTGSAESSVGSTEVSSSPTSIPGTINYTAVFDEETTAPELDGEAKYTPVFEEDASAPSLDGVANYTIGEYPTTIDEHASGIADYEMGEYPLEAPEIPGLVDYDIGLYPTTIDEHATGIADYSVNDSEVQAYKAPDKEGVVTYSVQVEGDTGDVGGQATGSIVTFSVDSSQVEAYVPEGKEATVTFGKESSAPDGYQPTDKDATVIYGINVSQPNGYQPGNKTATVNYIANTSLLPTSLPTITRTVNYVASGDTGGAGSALGTAHTEGTARANGTAYNMWSNYRHSVGAYANGTRQNWTLPRNETALTNETGQESIVFKCDFTW